MVHGRRLAVAVVGLLLVAGAHTRAQEGSFQRDGVRLFYRAHGTGVPIVFLSGGPGFHVDYMIPVAEFFPPTFTRIFYEQRGTGRSIVLPLTPETLSLEHVVADLEALRVHLRQERLLLVGHSWGGMLAMAYAAAHPDRIDRMILIGSGGATMEFTRWFDDNIRVRLRPEDLEAERYWTEATSRGVPQDKAALEQVKSILPGYFFDRAKALAMAAELEDDSFKPQINAILISEMLRGYDLTAPLQKLNRPVLIVAGHQDPMGDKTAEDLHDLMKGSTLRYIPKAGHFPWLEEPDEFRTVVAEFLAER